MSQSRSHSSITMPSLAVEVSMPIHWTNIRIPRDLHERLVTLAEEMYRRYDHWHPGQFRSQMPSEFFDRGIPIWWVIQRAMAEIEGHRRRSRRRSRKKAGGGRSSSGPASP